MPYVNDMSSLADIVSPVAAAGQAGLQNEQANTQQAIANQVAAGQAPAEIAKPGLANLFTQAQTAGQNALAQGEELKNIGTAGTLGSSINATNTGNQLKISQDQVGKLNTLGQLAGQIAGFMDNVPAPARPAAMQQILQKQGIDPSQLGPLASGDPALLRQASSAMLSASPDFAKTMAEQNLRNQGSLAVAQEGSNARVASAQASAQARIEAANIVSQVRQNQQTFEQAAVAAQKRGDAASYNMYSKLALQAKQMAAGVTSQLVTGQGLEVPAMAAPQGIQVPQTPATPTQPAAGGGQGFDINAAMAEAQRRGLVK